MVRIRGGGKQIDIQDARRMSRKLCSLHEEGKKEGKGYNAVPKDMMVVTLSREFNRKGMLHTPLKKEKTEEERRLSVAGGRDEQFLSCRNAVV